MRCRGKKTDLYCQRSGCVQCLSPDSSKRNNLSPSIFLNTSALAYSHLKPKESVETYASNLKLFNKTYGEWTTEWWRWLLSAPEEISPLTDKTGIHSGRNQPFSGVWFLAGCFPNTEKEYPSRATTTPKGRSILFPVINCSASRLEYPHLKTDLDLLEHVEKDMDSIIRKDCFIDGVRVIPERVRSEPQLFQVTILKNNAFKIDRGGSTLTAADGYWVFLKPLPSGEYLIRFEGSCELGRLNSGASYKLKVL